MEPHPVTDTLLQALPHTGIVVIGIRTAANLDQAFEADDETKELADKLKVYCIVNGENLADQIRALPQDIVNLFSHMHCTWQECDTDTAFNAACTIFHRRTDELAVKVHPPLEGRTCPDPLCEVT